VEEVDLGPARTQFVLCSTDSLKRTKRSVDFQKAFWGLNASDVGRGIGETEIESSRGASIGNVEFG
jgi:hypothetical protein